MRGAPLFLATLGVCLALAGAAVPAAADHLAYGPVLTVDPDSLKGLLDRGEALVAVDLRSPKEFGAAHLPGARSVPLGDLPARLAEIPRAAVVVLYGPGAPPTAFGAYHLLKRAGYPRVLVLEEGFGAWTTRGYPVER